MTVQNKSQKVCTVYSTRPRVIMTSDSINTIADAVVNRIKLLQAVQLCEKSKSFLNLPNFTIKIFKAKMCDKCYKMVSYLGSDIPYRVTRKG